MKIKYYFSKRLPRFDVMWPTTTKMIFSDVLFFSGTDQNITRSYKRARLMYHLACSWKKKLGVGYPSPTLKMGGIFRKGGGEQPLQIPLFLEIGERVTHPTNSIFRGGWPPSSPRNSFSARQNFLNSHFCLRDLNSQFWSIRLLYITSSLLYIY